MAVTVYGVDIEPACKAYQSDHVTVLIGDQGDRAFWKSLDLPPIDIVIDDGGHLPEQMIVTLEELLPRLSPESVYLVEDIHGTDNEFLSYTFGLIRALNAARYVEDPEAALAVETTGIQRTVSGIHVYPFVTVLELNPGQARFRAPKKGTEWQPF